MIDMLACELSTWSGQAGHCRWCDKQLTGRQRAWCSKTCYASFTNNHKYTAARRATLIASRADCACGPEAFVGSRIGRDGEITKRRLPKHPVCSKCGKCDRDVGQLECNHVRPRLGDKAGYSCLHHLHNLEMCCRECHLAITREQRSQWKPRKPRGEAVAEIPRQRSVKSKPVKRASRRRAA